VTADDEATISEIRLAVSQGLPVDDEVFDRLYPFSQRTRSSYHWTPMDIALRVCALLEPSSGEAVLDIGAGVGKMCLVGALATAGTWHGIELDARMVHAAEVAARRLGVAERTHFAVGAAGSIDWAPFAGFYLYNPFAESLFKSSVDPAIRRGTYLENLAVVERKLASARAGTRVVTYHGFGGDVPDGFELVTREPAREDELCLWIRRARRRGDKATIPLA
jgi:hypothetical protein